MLTNIYKYIATLFKKLIYYNKNCIYFIIKKKPNNKIETYILLILL